MEPLKRAKRGREGSILCETALGLQRDGPNSRFNFGAVVQLKNSKQLKVSKKRDLHNPVF